MKDAKGHGSNPRGGLSATERRMAAHGQRVLDAVSGMGRTFARPTGFPVGGWYATHPETGETLRAPNAKYGDLPPRFATAEKAHTFALKIMRRQK